MSIENPTFAHFRHLKNFSSLLTNGYIISTKDYVRIYKLFMQNKPNLRNDKMNITIDMITNYKNLSAGSGVKTKPIQTQFKPIQTQTKPKQTQTKPKQTQFKPISKPKQSQLPNAAPAERIMFLLFSLLTCGVVMPIKTSDSFAAALYEL